ncbi:cadherin-like beta sandwich domain-containing protein [Tumebacillus algifaecis]|nr:cadherin-like beta sandwich domain-containing protein [Tumebacillus algifaecis]
MKTLIAPEEDLSTNAKLSQLTVTNGTLNKPFDSDDPDYEVSVPEATGSISIKPTLDDLKATMKINTAAWTSGVEYPVSLNKGETKTVEIKVQAEDPVVAPITYTLTVKRAASSNADLDSLQVTPLGSLVFNPATTSYTVSVPYGTTSVSVTAKVADSGASLKIKNQTATSEVAFPVTLDADGSTPIQVEVKAANGNVKTYTITVNEAAPSTNAYLTGIKVDGTALSGFDKEQFTYTKNVPYTTESVTVEAALEDLTATLKLDGNDWNGAVTNVPLTAGVVNEVRIVVLAQDGSTDKTYTVKITRAAPSTNAYLTSIKVDGAALSGFDKEQFTYTKNVPYTTESVTVEAALEDLTATLKLDGNDWNGAVTNVPLTAGVVNEVRIVVLAQDGSTDKTYTVKITRAAPSTNAYLTSIKVDGAALSGFDKEQFTYTKNVPYTTESVTVEAALEDLTATLKLDGNDWNGAVTNVPLTAGVVNEVRIVVLAQDGSTDKTYTVKITRAAPSTNAYLTGIKVDGTALSGFDKEQFTYTKNVPYTTESVTVEAALEDLTATLKLDGNDWNGAVTNVPLTAGVVNEVRIVVLAQDGSTDKTYTVKITRAAPSTNAYLTGIKVDGTALSGFDKEQFTYTKNVPYTTESVTVEAALEDLTATLKLDGNDWNGAVTNVPLTAGVVNEVRIVVLAQDGSTDKTYTVKITRAAPSTNAYLTGIKVDGTALSGFDKEQFTYTKNVPYTTESVTVEAALEDLTATLKLDGNDWNGAVTNVPLTAGVVNEVRIDVLAQDGSTDKTYTVKITRAAPSTNAYLTSIKVDGAALSGFDKEQFTYTKNVPYTTESVTVEAALEDLTATLKLDGNDWNGAVTNVPLTAGVVNEVRIVVLAQDGSTDKTYTVNITRAAPSTDASLSNLGISTGTLTPGFSSGEYKYTLSVPYTINSIDVTPTVNDHTANVKVGSKTVISGNAELIALNVGTNTITVLVTAQDSHTTLTYTIIVTRATAPVSPVDETVKGTLQGNITKLIGTDLTLRADIIGADGKTLHAGVEIDASGKFTLTKIDPGSYRMVLYVIAPDGTKLAGQTTTLTVNSSKEATASAQVIDPFGVVTDSRTEQAIEGVKVTVYWADTALNKSLGRTPGTQVTLPKLPAMANQNQNGQLTSIVGQFGWMLFPEGDYYIVAEKDGYETYNGQSAVFHVGQNAVKTNLTLEAKVLEEGTIEPYINGYPDGTFKPNKGITRGELAVVLLKVLKIKAVTATVAYSDVDNNSWSAQAIAEITKRGLMVGYPDGTFRPNQEVSRAEIAIVLGKVKQLTAEKGSASFHDINGHWAKDAILLAANAGLISGYADGSYRPAQALTRAEAVVIFNKVLGWNELPVEKPQRWADVAPTHWAYKDIMRASVSHTYQKLGNGMVIWK